MIPVQFPEANVVLGRDQPEYEPLPVCYFGDAQGRVTFCCKLTPAELEEIARTKVPWVTQLTFGSPFQPIALSTQRPEDMPTVGALANQTDSRSGRGRPGEPK